QDELTNFGVWGGKEYIPQNYDGKFRGPVTLREALAQSLNIPSIKVFLDMAGIQDSINTARDMGLTTIKDASHYGPALVLGGGEVKLLDMVSAYGVFATEGIRLPYLPILRIENERGDIIKQQKNTPIRILSQDASRLLNDVLADNVARTPIFGGSSSLVVPGYQVSVKTGTTQEYRDAWAVGYTPLLAAGVWAGNSNNEPIRQSGVMIAAPVWNQFMREALPLVSSR
ncbi:MAG: penicillin-binding protein, partial [Candidatus Wildermuthbacteria bacterium]|nr:penicillin-binding protein [Candidatus Wildermuthbacteria bacterium]